MKQFFSKWCKSFNFHTRYNLVPEFLPLLKMLGCSEYGHCLTKLISRCIRDRWSKMLS